MATEFSGLHTDRARTNSEQHRRSQQQQNDEPVHVHTHSASVAHGKLSRSSAPQALGWLSIGLGLTALLAPRAVGNLTGLGRQTNLLRLVGVRELVSGIGLLTQENKTPWLWSRVLGDTMDLAVLGGAALSGRRDSRRAMGATAVVAAITAADIAASIRQTALKRDERSRADAYVEKSIIVNKSPEECFAFWRDLTNLPKFMSTVESVTPLDDQRMHWTMKGPHGARFEWDTEISVDRPGERLAWHSVQGSPINQASVIRFDPAPGNRGTLLRVHTHFQPPAGRFGLGVAKLLGHDPAFEMQEDLRRFKQLIETGELPTTRGQPSGRRSFLGRFTREGRRSRQGSVS